MLCMALGELLTGVSYVQIDDPPAGSNGGVWVVIFEGLHRWAIARGDGVSDTLLSKNECPNLE